MTDATNGQSTQNLLLQVLENMAPFTGDEFFQQLTLTLAELCNVRWSFIDEMLLDTSRVHVIASCDGGEVMEPWDYDLVGTPCAATIANGRAVYNHDVWVEFADDVWLAEVGAQAYVGVLLRTRSGDAIGILSVLHNQPLETTNIVALLEALAPRVAAEIERRQMDNALRRNEARFRLLAEYSKDILYYCQMLPRPVFEYVSPAVAQITGYPPEAFRANPDLGIQMIVPEDRHAVRDSVVNADETPITARAIRADGREIWLEYHNFPMRDAAGRIVAVGGTIRDATRRIDNEQAVQRGERVRQALLDAVPDTILHVNAAGNLLAFIPGEAAQGIRSALDNPIGSSLQGALPAFELPLRRLIETVLRTNHLQRRDFEMMGEGGESRFYEARCVPFGEHEVLVILRDFTATKWHEGEEERHRLRDELDTKVESLRTNLYGLTYRELAVLHLVAEGAADKQIAEALGISTYTVNKHVGNILSKMRAGSRTEAGVRAIREGLLAT